MRQFFKFFSVAYIIIFFAATLVANNIGLEIRAVGLGFCVTALCGIYLGYDYSKTDYK